MQFPSSPTLNQTYTFSNKTWKWNGKGWQIDAANSLSWANITGKPTEFTPSAHSHTISNVTGLQTALDAKAPATHVGETGTAHGVATTSVNGFMSSTDKSKLDGIASGAEVNQNAFSTFAVSGQSNVVADAKSDTVTFVGGTGVTITTNATTDTITFTNSAPDQTVSLTGSGATNVTGTYPNFTISSTDTTYSLATATTPGLIELGSNTVQSVAANAVSSNASRTYAVQLNANGQAVVNVPWNNTNTTYTAGNGLTLTSTTFAVGTPSSVTLASTNGTTATSHTHTFAPGGSTSEYIRGDGTLATFPSIGQSVTITNDTTTDTTQYIPMARATSGDWSSGYVASTKLYFNPSTGTLNSTNFNSLSDRNFKTNIEPIHQDTVNKFSHINPVSFEWKDTGKSAFGVIAQEIEPLFPELVNTNEQDVKSVSYDQLVPILISVVQQQQREIDSIKAKLGNLS